MQIAKEGAVGATVIKSFRDAPVQNSLETLFYCCSCCNFAFETRYTDHTEGNIFYDIYNVFVNY